MDTHTHSHTTGLPRDPHPLRLLPPVALRPPDGAHHLGPLQQGRGAAGNPLQSINLAVGAPARAAPLGFVGVDAPALGVLLVGVDVGPGRGQGRNRSGGRTIVKGTWRPR